MKKHRQKIIEMMKHVVIQTIQDVLNNTSKSDKVSDVALTKMVRKGIVLNGKNKKPYDKKSSA